MSLPLSFPFLHLVHYLSTFASVNTFSVSFSFDFNTDFELRTQSTQVLPQKPSQSNELGIPSPALFNLQFAQLEILECPL